jgi:hypothetical protein
VTAEYVLLSLGTPVVYAVLAAAVYMLLARDTITHWLWSRYPKKIDKLVTCTTCSGTWYGLGLGILGFYKDWPFLGFSGNSLLTVLIVTAWGKVMTPLIVDKLITAIINTSEGSDHGEAPNA